MNNKGEKQSHGKIALLEKHNFILTFKRLFLEGSRTPTAKTRAPWSTAGGAVSCHSNPGTGTRGLKAIVSDAGSGFL